MRKPFIIIYIVFVISTILALGILLYKDLYKSNNGKTVTTKFEFTNNSGINLFNKIPQKALGEYYDQIVQIDNKFYEYYNNEDFDAIYNKVMSEAYRHAVKLEDHEKFFTELYGAVGKHIATDYGKADFKITVEKKDGNEQKHVVVIVPQKFERNDASAIFQYLIPYEGGIELRYIQVGHQ
jgi:hypothetical protein